MAPALAGKEVDDLLCLGGILYLRLQELSRDYLNLGPRAEDRPQHQRVNLARQLVQNLRHFPAALHAEILLGHFNVATDSFDAYRRTGIGSGSRDLRVQRT